MPRRSSWEHMLDPKIKERSKSTDGDARENDGAE